MSFASRFDFPTFERTRSYPLLNFGRVVDRLYSMTHPINSENFSRNRLVNLKIPWLIWQPSESPFELFLCRLVPV